MTGDPAGSTWVFLDACCVLNLYATGRMGEILSSLSERFAVLTRRFGKLCKMLSIGQISYPIEADAN